MSLEAATTQVSITVKGDATCEWAVTKDAAATWLTVAPASVKQGQSVQVSATANEGAARKAVITFTPATGQAKPLQVVQKAKG